MALLVFSVLLLFSLVVPGQQIDLRFLEVLDTKRNVLLWWGFDMSTEQIAFELQVKTTGWVGFGLSPNGGMTGADIVIGGVFPNKTIYFSDYHGIMNTAPVTDTLQNYQLLSLTENGTFTSMRFSRAFRTCDSNDMNITVGTFRVISAFGTDDTIAYHGDNDFTKSINLLQAQPAAGLSPPTNSMSYDMKMSNLTVTTKSTTYGCAFIRLPNVTEKHHIYKIEPLVQDGNEHLVHHVLLYACPNNTNISSAPGECYSSNPLFFQCWQVMVAWAIGGEGFQFPDNAGLPIGSPGDPTYARLEIHYNSPDSNFTDNSGIRLYYTNNLRKYDAGILETGSNFINQFIPPKAQSFRLYGLCKTEKFKDVNGQDVADLQVFAYGLHTHLAGRAVQVAHYRNGSQIGFLGRDKNYDFNLQEIRYMENTTTIKMGDIFQVECTYNTIDRTNITMMGLGTMDEMCLAFLYYYPKNNIANCLSFPDPTEIALALNISSVKELYSIVLNSSNIDRLQRTIQQVAQMITIRNGQKLSEDFMGTGNLYNITEPFSKTCNSATFSTSLPSSNSDGSSTTNTDYLHSTTRHLQGSVALLSFSLLLLQVELGSSLWPHRESP